MFTWIADTLRAHPELAVFLSLGLGYWFGKFTFKSFTLGAVTGTLLAGLLVGQLGIDVSSQIKSIFFLFFLFAVGYGIGPQFVRGVASDGAPQAVFAVVVSLLALGSVYIAATIAGYGPGFAAGLMAGTQTISASIGTATDAINSLGLPDAQNELDHIAVAYAVTYLFGTIGTGWIIAFIGPKLIGVDIEVECKRYERENLGRTDDVDTAIAWHQHELRAFSLPEGHAMVGETVRTSEHAIEGSRVFIEKIRRNNQILDAEANTVLNEGDVLAISASHETLVKLEAELSEVEDRPLLSIEVESLDVVITSKAFDGKTIEELATDNFARGVYLNSIKRGSLLVDVPILPKTKINRGDLVRISGSKKHIEAVVKAVGYADRPTNTTSMIMVGLGIFLGGMVGAIVLNFGTVPITLSTSGGALIAGLILGWLRSFHPGFGVVPAPTLWFMNSVGLNAFIAVVGIQSGPTFISGLQEAGVSLFFWGIFATSLPMFLAPLIGKYIFKFDPAINLGCCGGARTSTASVAMVADVAKSNVPMLGYTVPYAISNTLLTLWGLVIVLLIA